jgi:hypothetical protein
MNNKYLLLQNGLAYRKRKKGLLDRPRAKGLPHEEAQTSPDAAMATISCWQTMIPPLPLTTPAFVF